MGKYLMPDLDRAARSMLEAMKVTASLACHTQIVLHLDTLQHWATAALWSSTA